MIIGGGPLQQSRPPASVGGTGPQSNDGSASGSQPIDGGGGGGGSGGGGSPSNVGGVGLSPDRRPGNRLGALIGGGSANQRGGPMLVIGNDNDETF